MRRSISVCGPQTRKTRLTTPEARGHYRGKDYYRAEGQALRASRRNE